MTAINPFDELFKTIVESSKEWYRINKPESKSQGKPSDAKSQIFYFIKIGYLLADPIKGLKLNPDFMPLNQIMGSGTTAFVVRSLNRKYLGSEINLEYIKLCNKRLAQQTLL